VPFFRSSLQPATDAKIDPPQLHPGRIMPSIDPTTARRLACLACLLLGLLVGCQSAADKDKEKWPHWKAADVASQELGVETTIFGVKLRPPKGFQMQPESSIDLPEGSKAKIVGWAKPRAGDVPGDESIRAIQLMVSPLPEDQKVPSPLEASDMLIESIQAGIRHNWRVLDKSYGYINGHEFYRVTWAGNQAGSSHAVTGHFYVGVIDGSIYQLATQDLEHEMDDLDVCDASILSFTK